MLGLSLEFFFFFFFRGGGKFFAVVAAVFFASLTSFFFCGFFPRGVRGVFALACFGLIKNLFKIF